jgi:hypothetical protein
VLCQRIGLFPKAITPSQKVDSPASAALQGSATASRAIAMLLPLLWCGSGDLPPAARMLKFVLSFYLTILFPIFWIVSRNSVVSVVFVVHGLQAAPLGFAEPTLILCWFTPALLSHCLPVKKHTFVCWFKMAKCWFSVGSEMK